MVPCWWRLSKRKRHKIMASKSHLKKWFLRPIFLSGLFLVLLSLAGGPLTDLLFLPSTSDGGFYWPRFSFSIVSVFTGPFSIFIAHFIGIEGSLVEMLPSFFIGAGIIGWWILCMKRDSFFFPIPVLFWAIIGAFWFVMIGSIGV